mgnify:CR=1 FL=1
MSIFLLGKSLGEIIQILNLFFVKIIQPEKVCKDNIILLKEEQKHRQHSSTLLSESSAFTIKRKRFYAVLFILA